MLVKIFWGAKRSVPLKSTKKTDLSHFITTSANNVHGLFSSLAFVREESGATETVKE